MSSPAVASPIPLEVPAPRPRTNVSTNADSISIPAWVCDFESFRRWAISDEFPEQGRIEYINGDLWVDLSMEQLFWHNGVKTEYASVLRPLAKREKLGYWFSDGVRLNHPAANLSTEPDGLFVSFRSIHEGRTRLIEGAEDGFTEVEGSPDATLEVVSRSSERKDTIELMHGYWQAEIAEYWLVDVRRELRFDLHQLTPQGYESAPKEDGWIASEVFGGRRFKLHCERDEIGNPQYSLLVRE